MESLYHSIPVGIKEEITIWAYNQPDDILGQSIFKKYKITNISTATTFNEMYLVQWADPDLGSYADDFVGCDSAQSACFVYNERMEDREFQNIGIETPVAGYVLLQGPIVPSSGDTATVSFERIPDFKNLPMTAFATELTQDIIDPPVNPAYGKYRWYNIMHGYYPLQDIDNPRYLVHKSGPQKGFRTKFPLNGDPLTGEGDLDGQGNNRPSGDRNMALVTGPFDLYPGETQEMVVALVGGQGSMAIPSMKVFYDNLLELHQIYKTIKDLGYENIDTIYANLPKAPPETMRLGQNYPNPFNPGTHIKYVLDQPGNVEMTVYNLLGQKVRTLIKGRQAAGVYTVDFYGTALASGVYIYTLKTGGRLLTKKMLLLR